MNKIILLGLCLIAIAAASPVNKEEKKTSSAVQDVAVAESDDQEGLEDLEGSEQRYRYGYGRPWGWGGYYGRPYGYGYGRPWRRPYYGYPYGPGLGFGLFLG